MKLITRSAALVATVLATLAACAPATDTQSNAPEGDLRGVEELGHTAALTGLASGEVTFVATSGVMAIAPVAETLVVVSKRASDSAILVNGKPQLDTLKAAFANSTTIKRINLTVGANNTTVIFDYANGTFNANTAPVSPALFGTGGSVVTFGSHTGCTFKLRGTSGNDTIYVGQDATPNAFISFSAAHPDIEIITSAAPAMGFSLGAGNDTFLATAGAAAFTTVMGAGTVMHSFGASITIHGGLGNDTIQGGSAADTIYGEEGYNTVDESTDSATTHVADYVYGLPANENSTWGATTVTYANWAGASGVKVDLVHIAGAGQVAAATTFGVTDFLDDTVGVVIGSPLADTMQCSQLTDMPCILQGGAGDDTLTPGVSTTNTHYLYGGDGNDTFAMSAAATNVVLTGGNLTDVMTSADSGVSKNLYTDTVDYSSQVAAATISMNVQPPVTCNVTDGGNLPCPPNVASPAVGSGIGGSALTFIRNDITVAKCPTGLTSAGLVCTVTGNNQGNTIYSGWGSDALTGGTGDDTFVIADFNLAANYLAATKVITGGGGSDSADFSAHTSPTVINLNGTALSPTNSGFPFALTSVDRTDYAPFASAAAVASATANTKLNTDYAAIALASRTANDTALKNAANQTNTDAAAVSAAITTWLGDPSAGNATAVATANSKLTGANLTTLNAAYSASGVSDSATVKADALAVKAAEATMAAAAAAVASLAGDIASMTADYNATYATANDTAEYHAAVAAVTAANALSVAVTAANTSPTATNTALVATDSTALIAAVAALNTATTVGAGGYTAPTASAKDTVTILSGSGDYTVTIGGNAVGPVAYITDDTTTAAAIVTAIGLVAPASALVTATSALGVVTLTAKHAGAGMNAVAVTVTQTGAGATAATATLTGGIGDTASVNADAIAIKTNASAGAASAAGAAFTTVSEQISLLGINNAVCPASASNSACVVTSNANVDLIDFNGDSTANGSSLTCEGSGVTTVNAQNLTSNCGG